MAVFTHVITKASVFTVYCTAFPFHASRAHDGVIKVFTALRMFQHSLVTIENPWPVEKAGLKSGGIPEVSAGLFTVTVMGRTQHHI